MLGAREGKLKETPASTPRLSSLPSFSLPLPYAPSFRVFLSRGKRRTASQATDLGNRYFPLLFVHKSLFKKYVRNCLGIV